MEDTVVIFVISWIFFFFLECLFIVICHYHNTISGRLQRGRTIKKIPNPRSTSNNFQIQITAIALRFPTTVPTKELNRESGHKEKPLPVTRGIDSQNLSFSFPCLLPEKAARPSNKQHDVWNNLKDHNAQMERA